MHGAERTRTSRIRDAVRALQIEPVCDQGRKFQICSLIASGDIQNEDWISSIQSALDSGEKGFQSYFLIDNTNAFDRVGLEGFKGVIQEFRKAGKSSIRIGVVTNDPLDRHRLEVFKSYGLDENISISAECFYDADEAKRWLIFQAARS